MTKWRVIAAVAVLMAPAAQPVWAGAPLKGIDVKLGKNARGQQPTAAPSPQPKPTPGSGLVGAAKVRSHSSQNNN